MNNDEKLRLGTILKIILLVPVAIVLLIAGTIMYKAVRYPNEVPGIFGYKPMIVLSGSMETSIYEGDLVFVKEVDTATLEKNDIIAFRNELDTVTTHRIVEIVDKDGKTYFRTKGDNNNTEDNNLVAEKDVEGIYVFRIKGAGNLLMFMKEPIGLALVLLVIIVIGLVWLFLINKIDEKKTKKEDEEYLKEFEEFKKRKQQQKIEQDE